MPEGVSSTKRRAAPSPRRISTILAGSGGCRSMKSSRSSSQAPATENGARSRGGRRSEVRNVSADASFAWPEGRTAAERVSRRRVVMAARSVPATVHVPAGPCKQTLMIVASFNSMSMTVAGSGGSRSARMRRSPSLRASRENRGNSPPLPSLDVALATSAKSWSPRPRDVVAPCSGPKSLATCRHALTDAKYVSRSQACPACPKNDDSALEHLRTRRLGRGGNVPTGE
jgi:hypothetical protein